MSTPSKTALAGALFAVLTALAAPARADILPSNIHPCADSTPGQPCQTDACNPGVCTRISLLCRKDPGDCLACLLRRDASTDNCDAACDSPREPCVVCAADNPTQDEATATYRWNDCQKKHLADPCKTEDCTPGVCAPYPCEQPPCPPLTELRCAVPPPSSPSSSFLYWTGAALTVTLTFFAALRLRRPRPAKPRSPSKDGEHLRHLDPPGPG